MMWYALIDDEQVGPVDAAGMLGLKQQGRVTGETFVWRDGMPDWLPLEQVRDLRRQMDDLEADALYDLIEHDVTPKFYDHDHEGVPSRWLEMVRHTLKSLGPKVLATRMVRDYVRTLYAPACVNARALNADYSGAAELAAWKKKVRAAWPHVRVEHVESSGVGDAPEVGPPSRSARSSRSASAARPHRRSDAPPGRSRGAARERCARTRRRPSRCA